MYPSLRHLPSTLAILCLVGFASAQAPKPPLPPPPVAGTPAATPTTSPSPTAVVQKLKAREAKPAAASPTATPASDAAAPAAASADGAKPADPANPAVASADAPTTPALTFEKTSFDFGKVDEGASIDIVFPLQNSSDRVVSVKDIQTGCGCTTSTRKSFELQPGEKTEIKLSFNTHGRSGENHRTVHVVTDDPAKPTYDISFAGTIERSLWASLPVLNFGDMDEGKTETREFSIFYTKADPLQIKSVKFSDDRFKVEPVTVRPFENAKGKGQEYVYKVTWPGNLVASTQNYFSPIVFETEPSGVQMPNINLNGRVVSSIAFKPNRIWSMASVNQDTSSTIQLSSRAGKAFTVESVDKEEKLPATIEIRDGAKPSEKTLVAQFKAPATPMTVQTKLGLKVKQEGSEEITTVEIPVVYMVRAQKPVVAPSGQPIVRNVPSGSAAAHGPTPAATPLKQ